VARLDCDATTHDFVETNITGTLNLLEEAATTGVKSFVFTSVESRCDAVVLGSAYLFPALSVAGASLASP
jgi:UDP-glucose 4-epimerase